METWANAIKLAHASHYHAAPKRSINTHIQLPCCMRKVQSKEMHKSLRSDTLKAESGTECSAQPFITTRGALRLQESSAT